MAKGEQGRGGPALLEASVLEAMPVAVYAVATDGLLTYANAAAARCFGSRPALGIDRWCLAARLFRVDGSTLPGEELPIAQLVRGQREFTDLRALIERPDGARALIEFRPVPILNRDGAVAGAVETVIEHGAKALRADDEDGTLWHQRADQFAQQIAAIVESSDDAIISTDLAGKLTSWNAGAERLLGYTADEAIGQGVELIYPEGHKEDALLVLERIRRGERIDHYETIRRRRDGTLIDISLTVSPVRDLDGNIIGASKIARDITDRRRVEEEILQHSREQAALYRLTDALFHLAPMPEVFDASIDAISQALGCDRAAVGLFDTAGALGFVAKRGLSEAGLAAVAAHCPWRPADSNAAPVVVPDLDAAPGFEGMTAALHAESVRALALVPIATSAGVEGGLLISYSRARPFTQHEIDVALSISRQIGFGIERARAEKQRDLLVVELSHRVKNTLANVLAIAQQTFRGGDEQRRQKFEGRILALGQTHTRLAEASWSGVSFDTILRDELGPYRDTDDGSIRLEGPSVTLKPRAAVMLGMAFHELATNASKYGALSSRAGRIEVSWKIEGDSLISRWREFGGPTVSEPKHAGFGRLLLERALTSDLCSSVSLQFARDGVTCEFVMPLERSVSADWRKES